LWRRRTGQNCATLRIIVQNCASLYYYASNSLRGATILKVCGQPSAVSPRRPLLLRLRRAGPARRSGRETRGVLKACGGKGDWAFFVHFCAELCNFVHLGAWGVKRTNKANGVDNKGAGDEGGHSSASARRVADEKGGTATAIRQRRQGVLKACGEGALGKFVQFCASGVRAGFNRTKPFVPLKSVS